MKKDILFVIPSLAAGGGEKSLINVLTLIDFDQYNVDLLLFNPNGIFTQFLPNEVELLQLSNSYQDFTLPLIKSLIKFLKRGDTILAYNRIMFTIKNRYNSNSSLREQRAWKNVSKSIVKLEKKYDVAIGFLEKSSIYFCVDKVDAEKKIGWVHSDYEKLEMDPTFDIHYFKQLDNLVTVSEECKNILKEKFPTEIHKIDVMYNIVSPIIINKMANQVQTNIYNKKDNEIVVLSIGRLHYQKGFELAIEACNHLINKGFNIKWFVIGEGEERGNLMELIKEYNIEENFKLLGLKANPYPYIKQADIYVQTSKFEGKSIALDEAKILQKPILITNYSTAKDQINNNKNGLIVEMDVNSIANGIEKIITDKNKTDELIENLSKEELGTEGEINKLYKMFGGDSYEKKYLIHNE